MKNRLILSILLGVMITTGWITVSETAIKDISSGIVRLHILANSNSVEDQTLKLKVRDRVLKDVKIENVSAIDTEKIEEICKNEIEKNGYDFCVKVLKEKCYFPTKTYKNITLPAGNYDAVRILIGEAKGENWWCVMYPPLCFGESVSGEFSKEDLDILKQSMKEDSFNMIESNEIKLKPSLKIVEIWQKLKRSALCF